MYGVVLQSATEAGTEGALRDLLLMVITVLLAVIAWGAKRAFGTIKEYLESIIDTQERQGRQIEQNSVSLFGKDGTPWDGFEDEIKKSRSGIIQTQRALNQQAMALKRHRRALKRAGLLAPNRETQNMNPEFDDLETLGDVEDV